MSSSTEQTQMPGDEAAARLALALSELDGEVTRRFPGGTESRTAQGRELDFANCGRRWCPDTVRERADHDTLTNVLQGGLDAASKTLDLRTDGGNPLVDGSGDGPNLHVFLDAVLRKAVETSMVGTGEADRAKVGAGAIYLHDWLHDELVMAASSGFPLCKLDEWHDGFLNCLRSDSERATEWRSEVNANLRRLRYIQQDLRPGLAGQSVARHPWVRQELQGRYDGGDEFPLSSLDCNKALIGVAYYERRRGITGQLFDRIEGEKLERVRFHEEDGPGGQSSALQEPGTDEGREFVEALRDGLRKRLGEEGPLFQHLHDELLWKRTVVFELRDQMAAGRQVKAGVYEGLQFPLSGFIGPFLGTVLRFNGEHLGILKVEKHKFNREAVASGKTNRCPGGCGLSDPKAECACRMDPVPFVGDDTAGFLVLAYALAGVLYVMKHHAGLDLSEGWTRSMEQEGA